jgi:hypothetical protein
MTEGMVLTGKSKDSEIYLYQSHFFHHNSHKPALESSAILPSFINHRHSNITRFESVKYD